MRKYYFSDNEDYLWNKKFQLSEKLLDIRYETGLTFEATADYLGLSNNEYLKYEYGDLEISESSYIKTIEKLNKLPKIYKE